jgi:hypothetical protein
MRPSLTPLLSLVLTGEPGLLAKTNELASFDVQQPTEIYYSEGANAADLNRDGQVDLIYGPHWYAGPDFNQHNEFYPAKPQPTERYANSFFTWPYDFDGNGWIDLLIVGQPGTPAYLYENPGGEQITGMWKRHQVFADDLSPPRPRQCRVPRLGPLGAAAVRDLPDLRLQRPESHDARVPETRRHDAPGISTARPWLTCTRFLSQGAWIAPAGKASMCGDSKYSKAYAPQSIQPMSSVKRRGNRDRAGFIET